MIASVCKISSRYRNIIRSISLVSCGGALVYALMLILCKVSEASGIYYKTALRNFPGGIALAGFAAAGAVTAFLLTTPWRSKWEERLFAAEGILRPAWLLWLIPATEFPWILLTVTVISWVVFRSGNIITLKLPDIPAKWLTFILISGWLLLTVWGYHVQVKAYDSLYFIYGDWNQYAAHYQHLLSGGARWVQWFAGAGHWNFGVNIVMTGLFKLWNAPDTIFIVNASVIASAIPLSGWLSRKCRNGSWAALSILPVVVLNPVLSNQFLAHFYGFHPIVFFIPLILGFFIAREYKCRRMMALMLVLSLMVQETVCVIWAGYAIYLLCCKRWKRGVLLLAAMIGFFFFLSRVVIPAAHDTADYTQMFHYAQLGNNMGEVLLSPLLRPGAFWGTLFERSAVCFVLTLLVPFFFGVILNPGLLITMVPLAAGICLQNSAEFKSVLFWYGVEISAFALALTVVNWKNAENSCIGRWLNHPFSNEKLRKCSVLAVLASSLLCGILLAFIPGNKGPALRIISRPDAGEMLDFVMSGAGNFNRVIASSRLRGHFQFSGENHGIKSDYVPGDVIVLDLHDPLIDRPEDMEALRKKIAADKRVVPVTYCIWENHTIVIFKVLLQPVVLPQLPWLRPMPQSLFDRFGMLLDTPEKSCQLRVLYYNGQTIYRAMLKEQSPSDIEFSLRHKFADGSAKEAVVRFGNGIFPAYSVAPGTVFEFTVPGRMPDKIEVNVYNIK